MAQGTYRPDDVAVMRSALDDWCAIHHISPTSREGVAVAVKILDLMCDRSLTGSNCSSNSNTLPLPSEFHDLPLTWTPETKKPAAGGGAAGFPKRTDQRQGGGVPLVLQTSLGGGVGRLNHEALREEVHRFDELTIHFSRLDRSAEFATQPCAMGEAEFLQQRLPESNMPGFRGPPHPQSKTELQITFRRLLCG